MLTAQPRSRGRDEFMVVVRSGLRPHHYYLEVGCGGLAAGRHVVRFLLRGRYFCIEESEYLLRAAVEYEVPAAGLIHKRPRFLLNGDVNVGALLAPIVCGSLQHHFDYDAGFGAAGIGMLIGLATFLGGSRWLASSPTHRRGDRLHRVGAGLGRTGRRPSRPTRGPEWLDSARASTHRASIGSGRG